MTKKPYPLKFKPDLDAAARRWEAYFAGELIDRPLVCVTAPLEGKTAPPGPWYREHMYGDLDQVIDTNLEIAACRYYGGEAIPSMWMSFGCDEVAAYCSEGTLHFNDDSAGTNWSKPFVDDWETALPFRINENNPLWQRMLEFYRKAAIKTDGKILLNHIDLHTNAGLLLAARGADRLCTDMVDQPEMIDRAMESARKIHPEIWRRIVEAGKMDERGHAHIMYSMEGVGVVSCDFCCMIGPEMFRRWVLPAYEEEAALVQHAFHHWDGPGALTHEADILAIKGFHTIGYVPTCGHNQRLAHVREMPLMHRIQQAGKAIHFCGTPDECKHAHRELDPAKVMYCTEAKSVKEADELLEWFVKNT